MTRDSTLEDVLLQKLARWGSLPEGDLIEMLRPEDRLRFRPRLLDALIERGRITARTVGDERILSMPGRSQAAAGAAEERP